MEAPGSLLMKLVVALQAQIILAFQAEREGHSLTLNTLDAASSQLLKLKLGLFVQGFVPSVMHILILLFILKQGLMAFSYVIHPYLLFSTVCCCKCLEVRFQGANEIGLKMDIVTKDVSKVLDVIRRYERFMLFGRRGASQFIIPKKAIHAHLHDLLWCRLATEISELSEVIIEGMLPRDMACVLLDVANNASDSFVTSPWGWQLCFSKRFNHPRYVCIILRITSEVIEPLLFVRSGWV
jgi:hypothetical protein